ATADFNEDGNIDIVVTSYQHADVLLGQDDGTLTPEAVYALDTQSYFVSIADFNHDGHADFATASRDANEVRIYLGRGDGTFAVPKHVALSGGPVRPIAVDVNNDSRVDLVVNGLNGGSFSVALNTTPL